MVNFDRFSSLSSRVKTVTEATTPWFSSLSPKIKGLATASPKVRVIAAGGALAVLAGVAAPVALTQTGHDAPTPVVTATAANITTQVTAHDSGQAGGAKPATSPAPTGGQLHPVGIQGSQSDIPLSAAQMTNAKKIIQAGQSMGLPPRAWVIALATSMQETKLHNYGDLGTSNDHDSLGLFQQRPSSGWGTPQQLVNPTYAAKAFYKSLTQVDGWDKMPLTDAAQAVQVSAFGDRYAQWEVKAGDVVNAVYGHGPMTHATS